MGREDGEGGWGEGWEEGRCGGDGEETYSHESWSACMRRVSLCYNIPEPTNVNCVWVGMTKNFCVAVVVVVVVVGTGSKVLLVVPPPLLLGGSPSLFLPELSGAPVEVVAPNNKMFFVVEVPPPEVVPDDAEVVPATVVVVVVLQTPAAGVGGRVNVFLEMTDFSEEQVLCTVNESLYPGGMTLGTPAPSALYLTCQTL